MVDFTKQEEFFSLRDVARLLPKRSDGKNIHLNTVYRWATAGLRGVVLETTPMGGRLMTTKDAVSRFFQQLGYARRRQAQPMAETRKRSIEEAKSNLRRDGFRNGKKATK
jgi:hypothetical protein